MLEKFKPVYANFMQRYSRNPENLLQEVWHWVKGYVERYQVSNQMRVRSFSSGVVTILKPNIDSRGYLTVCLCKNGKSRNFKLHRLVAQAFIPNPQNKPQVHHLDGDKLNCRAENLIWCTPEEHRRLERLRAMASIGVTAEEVDDTNFNAPSPTFYAAQLILTTQQLSEFYETNAEIVTQNFRRNFDKFVEGKHYFKLEGAVLKEFICNLQNEGCNLGISSMTRTLYLWTRRGCARHAKMLNTDKAWEVFELLEDAYFGKM